MKTEIGYTIAYIQLNITKLNLVQNTTWIIWDFTQIFGTKQLESIYVSYLIPYNTNFLRKSSCWEP